jgi:protein phosphatase
MLGWAVTDKGEKRADNQDYHHLELSYANGLGVCVVCDGMGGAKSGNIASKTAADAFINDLRLQLKSGMNRKGIKSALALAVSSANLQVYEKAQTDPVFYGMGTTLVGAVVTPDSAVIINVGDSRAYHITDDGIFQITRDHSLIEDLIERGEITREEGKTHPSKHLITRVLGTEDTVLPDLFSVELNEGDCLLLCSDGLNGVVEDQEILFEVLHGGDPAMACERLKDMANGKGGPDNITVVLVKI